MGFLGVFCQKACVLPVCQFLYDSEAVWAVFSMSICIFILFCIFRLLVDTWLIFEFSFLKIITEVAQACNRGWR